MPIRTQWMGTGLGLLSQFRAIKAFLTDIRSISHQLGNLQIPGIIVRWHRSKPACMLSVVITPP